MGPHTEKAKKIIENNEYVTIASLSRDRKPWVTPVYFAYDEDYNFFWYSAKDALHSQNVRANNEVAMVVFNSAAPEGTGEGVYIEALVYELEDEHKIAQALPIVFDRAKKPHRDVYDFVDNSAMRMYKAVPQKVWVSASEKMGSHAVDTRIEIKLK